MSRETMPHLNFQNPGIYLYGPGDARLEDSPMPQITNPHDVIVRIACVGVCGSDVHFWTQGGIGNAKVSPQNPLILGHEASGTIHSIGSAVTTLAIGDDVALEPGVPCFTCPSCLSGSYNLCPAMRFAAAPPSSHGTLVKFFKTHDAFCHKLSAHLSLKEGVLMEPLAVAVHICKMANVGMRDEVVVFGAGTVGLLCAAVAKCMGARKIVVVDINQERLTFAKEYIKGCGGFCPEQEKTSADDTAQAMIAQNDLNKRGATVVLEATGHETCINAGIHVLQPGGNFVQAGLGRANISFPIVALSEKEIHFHGSFRYSAGDFEIARQLLERRKVEVGQLVSGVVEFKDANLAWEMTRKGEGIKNVIEGLRD